MIPVLKHSEEKKKKENFWASDYGKLGIDILLALKDEPKTDISDWTSYLRMSAGKGVELQMLDILKENGNVAQEYTQDGESFKIERNEVPISMKFDALGKQSILEVAEAIDTKTIEIGEGEPIEVKTINNKNSFDISKYQNNTPRESYVGQLAIYMDALQKEKGHLFIASIDGLNCFWFVVSKIKEGIYQAGNVTVDLNKEYERWKKIWELKDKEIPAELIWEEKYKIPIEEIDWTKLSVSAIGDVRNGRKVVGTENKWKIDYSPYKTKILQMQGVTLGYTNEELEIIKAKTAGFSSKKTKVSP
jgi:hypothetical protein